MSQMNSVNMLMPYNSKIHYNIIFSPSPWPNGEGFSKKKICKKFSLLSFKIKALSISSYFIDLIILLTRKLSKGFGDFKIVAKVIHTVKYADDLVLLVKEETVLQCIVD